MFSYTAVRYASPTAVLQTLPAQNLPQHRVHSRVNVACTLHRLFCSALLCFLYHAVFCIAGHVAYTKRLLFELWSSWCAKVAVERGADSHARMQARGTRAKPLSLLPRCWTRTRSLSLAPRSATQRGELPCRGS